MGHEEHGLVESIIENFYMSLLQVEDGSPILEFLTHFTYDLIRTFLVFLVVIYIVSYIKTFISYEHIKTKVLGVNKWIALFIATLMGFFSSTCVCTNVPLFLGFLALGVPLNLAMTYLISSSLINVASITSMFAIDGLKFSALYLAASILISLIAGFILTFLKSDKYLIGNLKEFEFKETKISQKERFKSAFHELKHNVSHQWVWILLGVMLAAIIEIIVDVDFAQRLSSLGVVGVISTTIIGVVLHTDIIAILPVLSAFIGLNMNYGILFCLTTSLSFFAFPVLVMVNKTVKLKYMLITWAIMFILIILAGVALLPFYG